MCSIVMADFDLYFIVHSKIIVPMVRLEIVYSSFTPISIHTLHLKY